MSERAAVMTPRALTPSLYRVVSRRDQTADVATLSMEPLSGPGLAFRPGQFNMLSALGVGEIAVSVSSAPSASGPLEHTVRDVGAVSHALWSRAVGDLIGVRGPFGTDWRVSDDDEGGLVLGAADVVVVAGGIGLAPLRGAITELIVRGVTPDSRVFVYVGTRDPTQIVFGEDLEGWAAQGAHVEVTVDRGSPAWSGHVGVVTSLLEDARFNPARSAALICGPEIMMRFTARALVEAGVDPARILVSLERNMQCGVGWCGHCQLGPFLLCRDGPIVPYEGVVAQLLTERER